MAVKSNLSNMQIDFIAETRIPGSLLLYVDEATDCLSWIILQYCYFNISFIF